MGATKAQHTFLLKEMTSGILQQLLFCSNKRFTGKLSIVSLNGNTIQTLQGECWNVFFYRGRLIGDSGGTHPVRRLRRQFSRLSIQLPGLLEKKLLNAAEQKERNCLGIGELLAAQYIDREQATQIITGSLVEVLFDAFHYEATSQLTDQAKISCIQEKDALDDAVVPSVVLKSEPIWEAAIEELADWQARGLMKYSPNLCPEISDHLKFQAVASERTYYKLLNLLDKDRTLRDIATKIDEDVSLIAQGLDKYYKKKVLSFRRIGDIASGDERLSTQIHSQASNLFQEDGGELDSPSQRPLVVHLSRHDPEIKALQHIVEKSGYTYSNLREPGQAMLALLRCHPALILVDGESDFDAYDFCTQLRRTNKFRSTPIVFLGKSENMVSWMRGKMANYTCLIAKPLSYQKIFHTLEKVTVTAS